MITTEWAEIVAEKVAEKVHNGQSIDSYIGTPDNRNDGYDIACARHVDAEDELRAELKQRGVSQEIVIRKIYANGYFCGYHVIACAAEERIVNCQHPGSWGPWYHLSLYRRNPNTGKWRFVRELGRCGRGDSRYSYGRPID